MTIDEDEKEKIRDKLYSDSDSVIMAHLEDVAEMFTIRGDGTVDISEPYRSVPPKPRMLIYLIARRYQFVVDEVATPALDNSYFYKVIGDKSESTVRVYLSQLRDKGWVTNSDEGQVVVPERIPDGIEFIESYLN